MPTFYCSDNLIGIGSPGEGFRVVIGFCDEAVDGGLEVDEGMEDTTLEPPRGEFGEEALDSVESKASTPRTTRWLKSMPLFGGKTSDSALRLHGASRLKSGNRMRGASLGTPL